MRPFLSLVAGVVVVVGGLAARPVGRAEETPLTLLYTNDTQGYLQTCGCSHSGLGGLDRRARLIQQVRAEQPHVLLVDSGNQAEEAERARVVLKAMAAMGYDAVGVGPLDLQIADSLWKEAAAAGVPVCVSAPRPEGVPEAVPCVRRVEGGGVRVGIAALVSAGSEVSEEVVWAAVEPVLRELRAGSDLVVVLSQQGLGRDRALVRRQAQEGLIDLLIGNAEARSLTAPEVMGRTWLLPTTERGQEVGRVDVTFSAAGPCFTWRRIPLDRSFGVQLSSAEGPEPEVEGIVGAYYAAQAQRLLDASRLEADSLVQAAYVPAVKCGECHPSQYRQWLQQKHARAVEALAARQRLVPECLGCHSEQYRRTGKFIPNLGERDGVQCSTCHGEGVVHSLLERKDRIVRDPGEGLCVTCHDHEHDPGFGYRADVDAIRHK